jgi:hypothetical protein
MIACTSHPMCEAVNKLPSSRFTSRKRNRFQHRAYIPAQTRSRHTTHWRYVISAADRMIDSSFFRLCGCPSTIKVSPDANLTVEPGLNSRCPDRRLTPTTIRP